MDAQADELPTIITANVTNKSMKADVILHDLEQASVN
jgi:hypothetical protein